MQTHVHVHVQLYSHMYKHMHTHTHTHTHTFNYEHAHTQIYLSLTMYHNHSKTGSKVDYHLEQNLLALNLCFSLGKTDLAVYKTRLGIHSKDNTSVGSEFFTNSFRSINIIIFIIAKLYVHTQQNTHEVAYNNISSIHRL